MAPQIAAALDGAVSGALAMRKPTVQAFRQDVAERLITALAASSERALQAWAGEARALVDDFPRVPPVLAGLYSLAVALHDGRGWPELLRTLGGNAASWRPLVEAAEHVCDGTASAWNAVRSIALPGDVSALVGCDSLGDACAAHDAGWCADFWSAVCKLSDPAALIGATDALLRDLRVLTLVLRAQSSCDPAALAGLWQRGWVAWGQTQRSVAAWLDALTGALAGAADDAVSKQAAILLARLVPTQAAVADARATLAIVVPDAPALAEMFASVTVARDALAAAVATGALAEAGRACKQLGQTLATAGDAMLDRLILQPAAAAYRDRLDAVSVHLLGLAGKVEDAIIDGRSKALPALAKADAAFGLSGSASLACLLFRNPDGPCPDNPKDDLTAERVQIGTTGTPVLTLLELTEKVARRTAAAPQIVDKIITKVGEAVLAEALQLLDLGDVRDRLATALANLVPSSIRRSYDYVLPLEPVPGGFVEFIPLEDQTLRLTATGTVAVRTGGSVAGQFAIDTRLSPFALKLGDYLTLKFKAFTFRAGPGRSGKLDAPFDKVEIGASLAFITALAAYLGYSGDRAPGAKRNGPYLEQLASGPGLVAGFRLGVPDFNLGNVGFANIAFDGHCELPFDKKRGSVNLGLCSRERPFIISYAPYGGSGFVGITADAKHITGMDVSLEFGGAGVVSFGPLDGVGRLMSGIYCVKKGDKDVTLFSTFSSSFTGSIAGFGIVSSFVLALGWNISSKELKGEATLSFTFDTGLDIAITFKVKIARNEGGRIGASGASNAQTTEWIEDEPRIIPASLTEPFGTGIAHMPSALGDWAGHRRVFATVAAVGSRRSFT